MKKALVVFLISLGIICLGFYFAAGAILNVVSRSTIQFLSTEAEQHGIDIDEADFKSVSFRFPTGAIWRKLLLTGKVALIDLPLSGRPFAFSLDEVAVGLENYQNRTFFIKAKGLDALVKERPKENGTSRSEGGDHLVGDFLAAKFNFDFTHPTQLIPQAAALAQDLLGLLLHGRCLTFIEFSGFINFTMGEDGKLIRTYFRAERRGNESVLIMDPESLEKISGELKERLNNVEINFISENALKAPELLRITIYAQDAAEEAHRKNPAVPEDAYRHVLWSYLLTKEFGSEFSAQATAAHEQGDREETADEQRMDSTNNAIGREYAQKGYHELQIVELVTQDPRIIWHAD